MTDTVLDRVLLALNGAAAFDSNVVVAPVAILWADEPRQWESAVATLQLHRRIVRYGTLDATLAQGPAYWLRCVVADTVDVDGAPAGIPIVYLPGVSRDDIRSLDAVSAELASLGAIQHRCAWFSQSNGKDWTVRALLSNTDRGLGLDVAGDAGTAAALTGSLESLLAQPMARLASKHVDAAMLNALLTPDLVGSLLAWLDHPVEMRQSLSDSAWAAFAHQCKHDYALDPAAAGELEAARRLGEGEGEGSWSPVWERFARNPRDYPGIPERLLQAQPAELILKNPGAWPGANESAELSLRTDLAGLAALAPQSARDKVIGLDAEHKPRRGYVWADLDRAPLALALEHLAEVARLTSKGVSGTSVSSIADWYGATGWRTDGAVLAALKEVDRKADVDAVSAAIQAIYEPWLKAAAERLQGAVGPSANSGNYGATPAPTPKPGEVLMFIDGLRLDVAHLLAEQLVGAGLEPTVETGLAALPTVTQTSKPALVPIDQGLLAAGELLDARRAPDGPSAGVAVLRSLMAKAEVQVLDGKLGETGDPGGVAWTEAGDVDHLGHDRGVGLVHELDAEIRRITTRIRDLLDAGWQRVSVVTDHGWLLLPSGLPKCGDLPIGATETRKGRCARVKEGAAVAVPTVPWYWDAHVRIALAPGISCFEANKTYEHGGVSPQECVVPRISVSRSAGAQTAATITNLKWRGLTLTVELTGVPEGATVELRSTAGDAGSSIAHRADLTSGQGKELLIVGDDDFDGSTAHLVVVGSDGSLLLHRETTVGQNR